MPAIRWACTFNVFVYFDAPLDILFFAPNTNFNGRASSNKYPLSLIIKIRTLIYPSKLREEEFMLAEVPARLRYNLIDVDGIAGRVIGINAFKYVYHCFERKAILMIVGDELLPCIAFFSLLPLLSPY